MACAVSFLSTARAADPVIHVRWDEGPQQPEQGTHYTVKIDSPASAEFPDVELIAGHLDWRIWSVDTDNPDDVGDIGVISSPYAQNFAVTILDDSDGAGARNVKAITLDPTSSSNYSNILAGTITGDLQDDLLVQRSSGGTGGEVSLSISGDAGADMALPKVHVLSVGGEASGSIAITQLASEGGAVFGQLSGSVSIEASFGSVAIGNVSGSLDIDEWHTDFTSNPFPLLIDEMGEGSSITIGELDVGEFEPGGDFEFWIGDLGEDYGESEIAGTILFESGIKDDMRLTIWGELTETGVLDLNDAGVYGAIDFHGGGAGNIINGGTVAAPIELGNITTVFSGTATFQRVVAGGSIITENCSDLPGTIQLTGSLEGGSIAVTGDLPSSGAILIAGDVLGTILVNECGSDADGTISADGEMSGPVLIYGTFGGELCASNLSSLKPLPPNIEIDTIEAGASVCEGAAVTCGTIPEVPDDEPSPVKKNRFISLVPGNNGTDTAIAVNLDSLHHPATPVNPPDFTDTEEEIRWVNAFRDGSNNPVFTCPDESTSHPDYKCATLGASPEYYDWGAEIGATTVLHVTAAEIAPSSRYNVHLIADGCTVNWAAFSPGVIVETALWGDINDSGTANVLDISDIVDTILDDGDALPELQTLCKRKCLVPTLEIERVTVIEIARVVNAAGFELPYPFNVQACP
jgi:hypothetical protein